MFGTMDNRRDETVKRINQLLDKLVKLAEPERAYNDYPWIVFLLEDTEYAINTRYVLRVDVLYEIVPYADAQAHCPGVIWSRDGIIHLLDLRVLFGQGDYLSALTKASDGFPMIIVIEPDGKRRGMIVDKIVAMEYFHAMDALGRTSKQSGYIQGLLQYDAQRPPAFIIRPQSFNTLEFDGQDAKIDWKGRIDMAMKADDF